MTKSSTRAALRLRTVGAPPAATHPAPTGGATYVSPFEAGYVPPEGFYQR